MLVWMFSKRVTTIITDNYRWKLQNLMEVWLKYFGPSQRLLGLAGYQYLIGYRCQFNDKYDNSLLSQGESSLVIDRILTKSSEIIIWN